MCHRRRRSGRIACLWGGPLAHEARLTSVVARAYAEPAMAEVPLDFAAARLEVPLSRARRPRESSHAA